MWNPAKCELAAHTTRELTILALNPQSKQVSRSLADHRNPDRYPGHLILFGTDRTGRQQASRLQTGLLQTVQQSLFQVPVAAQQNPALRRGWADNKIEVSIECV